MSGSLPVPPLLARLCHTAQLDGVDSQGCVCTVTVGQRWMRVVKVGSRGVGARIEGLDLRKPLSPEQLQTLLRALHAYAVVCIPGQQLSAAEQCAFTRQLGDLVVHPAGHGRHPDPACPRNQFDDMSLVLHFNGKGRNDRWHTEISGMAAPPRYTVLHQHKSPGQGKGNTLFADMRAAFANLSPAVQDRLTTMDAVHGFYNYVTPQPERETQQAVWDPTKLFDRRTGALLPLEVAHPLVRVHDRVGTRACIYLIHVTLSVRGSAVGAVRSRSHCGTTSWKSPHTTTISSLTAGANTMCCYGISKSITAVSSV